MHNSTRPASAEAPRGRVPAGRAAADLPARFTDESDLRKYRTELPNIIDDLSLSVHAQRLYCHIKRRAGAGAGGECTAGLRGMAHHCKMSLGRASQARKELLDRGLIRSRVEVNAGGRFEVVTVVDIWPANFAFYDRLARGALTAKGDEITRAADAFLAAFLLSDGVHIMNTPPSGVHIVNEGVHIVNAGCSLYELKKEPLEERTKEEHTHTARARETPARPSAAAGVCVPSENLGATQNISNRPPAGVSAFSFAERKTHAEAHGLGPGWLQRSRSGEYDELIADARASSQPAAVEKSLREQSRPRMAYRAALLHLGSVLDRDPHANVAAAVAQLDVSDADRARLLAYDFTSRRAAAAAGERNSHDERLGRHPRL